MKKKLSNIWLRAVLVAVFFSVVSFFVCKIGFFDYLENKAYDRRMRNSSTFIKPADEIVFIAVTQESLDWAQEKKGWSWPWPRESYGQIVEFLSAGGVNSVMFDMIYSEPSVYGPEDDLKFAEAQKQSGNICHTIFIPNELEQKVVLPIEPIKNTAAIIANVTSVLEKDDVIRTFRPFFEVEGESYPSLGMAPLVLQGENFDFPTMKDDGTVKLRYQKSIDCYFPVDAAAILESYDAWKAGETGFYVPEDFSGTYAFFALYAPGLFDICSTPVSQIYPGVGVHLTALDNYLQKDFIYDVPQWAIFIIYLITAFLGAFLVTIGEKQKSQFKIILFLITSFILGCFIIFEIPFFLFIAGINMPQVGPLVSFVVSFAIMFVLIYAMEGKQRRFIKSAFSQCLSKDVVNEIINNPESFTLGGKKIEMSALFTDIEKFSSFSELLTANQLGELLNYYLTKMSDIIISEHGTIDKYEGDAIVAMVGAPLPMEDHAVRACKAALKMKKEEAAINDEIENVVKNGVKNNNENQKISYDLFQAFEILVRNKKRFFTRIGINSGEMIAGYFGSSLKKNYTIMGNNVNLASRLEGVNKQYSTSGILISESTRNEVGNKFVVRRLDKVQVVNVNMPLRLYELLDETIASDQSLLDYVKVWEHSMDDFESKNYNQALAGFEKCQELAPSDKVATYYINILKNYFIKGRYPTEADNIGVAYNPDLSVFKLLQK